MLKVYCAANLDGRNRAMVAALNLKEAAKRFGVSAGSLRKYGWSVEEDPEAVRMALETPGVVWYQCLTRHGAPWRKGG